MTKWYKRRVWSLFQKKNFVKIAESEACLGYVLLKKCGNRYKSFYFPVSLFTLVSTVHCSISLSNLQSKRWLQLVFFPITWMWLWGLIPTPMVEYVTDIMFWLHMCFLCWMLMFEWCCISCCWTKWIVGAIEPSRPIIWACQLPRIDFFHCSFQFSFCLLRVGSFAKFAAQIP